MEVDNERSVSSEHNINQNEATAGRTDDRVLQEIDLIQSKVIISEIPLLPNDIQTEPETVCSVPSIVVTPASPSSSEDDYIGRHIETNQTFPCLNPRKQNTLNTSCPEITHASEKQIKSLVVPKLALGEQTTISSQCYPMNAPNNEANIDVDLYFNCSSTPIKDVKKFQNNSLDVSKHSIMSLDAPSPIAKDNEATTLSDDKSPPDNTANNASSLQKNTLFNQTNPYMSPQNTHGQRNSVHVDTPRPSINIDRSLLQSNTETKHQENDTSMIGRNQSRFYHHSMGSHLVCNLSEFYSSGPFSENSWTDMSYRPDMSIPPLMTDTFFQSHSMPDSENFVYPSIYVSSAGLISVLLRNDMSVEMTVDRTIRVVSHNHMMAIATDSRGTAACLYHPAAKVFQVGPTTDIATDEFRARMGSGECIIFSNGVHYFKLEDSDLQPTAPVKFSDISRDQSVNLLFSSEGYGESLVASCMQVASQAEYSNLPKGGVIVRINGVKVTQTGGGDVSVVTGAKFIRLSPHFGTARLGNRFVDIEIEKDWTVKLTKGTHSFVSSRKCAMVCNGKMEAGFDENNTLKAANLVPRHPLLTEAGFMRRLPTRKPARFLGPFVQMPKRKPDPSTLVRGNRMF